MAAVHAALFKAVFGQPEHARGALRSVVPVLQLSYMVDDLSGASDDRLRARAMTAVARLVAACFKHARTRADLLEILGGWVDVVREVISVPRARGRT